MIGLHVAPLDLIINPIVETSSHGLSETAIEPTARIARTLSSKW